MTNCFIELNVVELNAARIWSCEMLYRSHIVAARAEQRCVVFCAVAGGRRESGQPGKWAGGRVVRRESGQAGEWSDGKVGRQQESGQTKEWSDEIVVRRESGQTGK